MKTTKVLASLALTSIMFLLPLAGAPALLSSPQILFLAITGFWSLLTQPAIDWRQIHRRRAQDHYTTAWIMVAIVVGQGLAVTEWAYFQPRHELSLNLSTGLGLVLILAGGSLRYRSIRTLGRYFTASVCVGRDQPIVADGPYKWLRHPSYTGGLLTVTGTPLLLGSTVAAVVAPSLLLLAYVFRVAAEEKAMLAAFGDRYHSYQKRTWRLLPPIW